MRAHRLLLTDPEFAELRELLARSAGLVFDETRRESVTFCIAERLRDTGAADVASYLPLLADPQERQALLDEVTIQETHFFRNPPQIRALRKHVLPELLRHADTHGRRLRIWSAGCSTGEEAYSIAMILRELLPMMAGWDIRVIGTDVSARALVAARTGRYNARAVHLAPPEQLGRFFQPGPRGTYEVRPEVTALVEFRHQNLVTDPVPFPPAERVDLILCRNVTIYFGIETTRSLMQRLHTCLRDGGYLFLGHSETLWQVSEDFRLVSLGTGADAAFVYRRLDAGPGERRAILPDRRTEEPPVAAAPERRALPRRHLPPVAVPAAHHAVSVQDVRTALADGRYDDAARDADLLIQAGPLDATGFYLRGLAQVSAGRDAQAVVDLRKAVYLEPAAGLSHFLLAGVLTRLGDAPAGAREYRAAAELLGRRPGDAGAPELGGRSVRDLVALCRQLAGAVDQDVS